MMRFIVLVGVIFIFIPVLGSAEEHASTLALSVDDVVVSGLSHPVQVTHAGDGSGRLFVVEQTGAIKIVKGKKITGTFLDLGPKGSDLVGCCGERGLLGLAFHPHYRDNGYFFLNYSRKSDGATVVARYTVSSNVDQADSQSAQILFTVDQPYANHNGGQIAFGPKDGYLYIGMGDGGSAGDPKDHGQNTKSLLGALLRIDVDQRSKNAADCGKNGNGYSIPKDNPFVDGPGGDCDELWATGVRNPWRFSFDGANGDLYIGDVGQNRWEEVSFQAAGDPPGRNFGWRLMEGDHCFWPTKGCERADLVSPIAEYDRDGGNSITGGFVYRGRDYPSLVGHYFYADYGSGKIWSLKRGDSKDWPAPELRLDTRFLISSFGEDEGGEVYVVEYHRKKGKVRRLRVATADYRN